VSFPPLHCAPQAARSSYPSDTHIRYISRIPFRSDESHHSSLGYVWEEPRGEQVSKSGYEEGCSSQDRTGKGIMDLENGEGRVRKGMSEEVH